MHPVPQAGQIIRQAHALGAGQAGGEKLCVIPKLQVRVIHTDAPNRGVHLAQGEHVLEHLLVELVFSKAVLFRKIVLQRLAAGQVGGHRGGVQEGLLHPALGLGSQALGIFPHIVPAEADDLEEEKELQRDNGRRGACRQQQALALDAHGFQLPFHCSSSSPGKSCLLCRRYWPGVTPMARLNTLLK